MRSHDPNKQRNEKQKLTRQVKKEFRGAQRELRRDAEFIARERVGEIKKKDQAYKAKIQKIIG